MLSKRDFCRTLWPVTVAGGHHICPSCKSHATDRVTDTVILRAYQRLIPDKDFVAYTCAACGAEWSGLVDVG